MLAALPWYERRISIHALRGEGDVKFRDEEEENKIFQSTPSVGRATYNA